MEFGEKHSKSKVMQHVLNLIRTMQMTRRKRKKKEKNGTRINMATHELNVTFRLNFSTTTTKNPFLIKFTWFLLFFIFAYPTYDFSISIILFFDISQLEFFQKENVLFTKKERKKKPEDQNHHSTLLMCIFHSISGFSL